MVNHYDRMHNALSAWKKFAYYALGKSGHSPITLPVWHATLFAKAVEMTEAIPAPVFPPDDPAHQEREQLAARVLELEEEVTFRKQVARETQRAEREAGQDRLRLCQGRVRELEAGLRFYADEMNYEKAHDWIYRNPEEGEIRVYTDSPVQDDGGQRAKTALAGGEP